MIIKQINYSKNQIWGPALTSNISRRKSSNRTPGFFQPPEKAPGQVQHTYLLADRQDSPKRHQENSFHSKARGGQNDIKLPDTFVVHSVLWL